MHHDRAFYTIFWYDPWSYNSQLFANSIKSPIGPFPLSFVHIFTHSSHSLSPYSNIYEDWVVSIISDFVHSSLTVGDSYFLIIGIFGLKTVNSSLGSSLPVLSVFPDIFDFQGLSRKILVNCGTPTRFNPLSEFLNLAGRFFSL